MNMKSKTLRIIVASLVIVVVALGFITNFGIGTISAPGFWDISILCPLGALGTMLATKLMIPRAVISLIAMVLLIVVFARAFCGWICPIPLVQKLRGIFSKKQPTASDTTPTKSDGAALTAAKSDPSSELATTLGDPVVSTLASAKDTTAPLTADETAALKASCSGDKKKGCATCAIKRGDALDARHFVLGGALASTFIFGFPVFCLVCPIGLTFATILLVINLFTHGDVTWSIIVVPALLIAEVLLFKKWCHKLCPLSAFMSLIAKANKTFVPTINDKKCLETARGVPCGACGRACEEGIDPRHPQLSETAWNECSKCRACVDACPTKAITMPLLPKKRNTGEQTVAPLVAAPATDSTSTTRNAVSDESKTATT